MRTTRARGHFFLMTANVLQRQAEEVGLAGIWSRVVASDRPDPGPGAFRTDSLHLVSRKVQPFPVIVAILIGSVKL